MTRIFTKLLKEFVKHLRRPKGTGQVSAVEVLAFSLQAVEPDYVMEPVPPLAEVQRFLRAMKR